MGARELLQDLAAAGFSVEANADKLLIRPASKLTDELRAAVRAAKPDLMALLTDASTSSQRCDEVPVKSADARRLLSVLDWLGPLDMRALICASGLPGPVAFMHLPRLRSAGLVERRERYWALTSRAQAAKAA